MVFRRIKRLIFRAIYYPSICLVKPLDLFMHGLYCKIIYRLLKGGGVNFTGKPNYISSDVYIDGFSNVTIGEDCVISKQVIMLTHDYSITTALKSVGRRPKSDVRIDGEISIGNNVFIGLRTTILPGTSIGNNVIIGAGSMVKGAIPDNVVAAGNPCKILMTTKDYLEKKEKVWSTLNIKND